MDRVRPSVAGYAFDPSEFAELQRRLLDGSLDAASNRLKAAPEPLSAGPRDLARLDEDERSGLCALGLQALNAGRVAALVLNGGMATRFGGGAKGAVPILPGQDAVSFLAVKLAETRRRTETGVAVCVMHSFATESASEIHLREIDWAGVSQPNRYTFAQSLMPRVLPDGTPLGDLDAAAELDDTQVYAAPGHGDTLARVRESGVLDSLVDRGVDHLLVSNVDNLGATLDPLVLGAHLQASERGAAMTVEVVARHQGDAGGCVAQLPGSGRAAIIEAFRLPEAVDLAAYPHFNTNTLWFSCAGLAQPLNLTWFAVHKRIGWPDGSEREVVQFERLIGQATEFLDSAYVAVDRTQRFVPIKTREDLTRERAKLERFARQAGLLE